MRKFTGVLAALFLLASCGGGQTELQAAYKACQDESGISVLEVADGGHSLIVDTQESGDLSALACAMLELEVPDSLVSEIDNTSAMMGRQTAEANGLTYSWSYHPDNGLNMTITDN